MTKRNPEFDGFSAYFAVRAETDRKGKSTPPARTETPTYQQQMSHHNISTHSAHEDGDGYVAGGPERSCHFNPLRPRGRRLLPDLKHIPNVQDFNPLRPRGRRLYVLHSYRLSWLFQPTPPTRTETAILHKKTNNSSSHFHNQITSYPLKSPPTYPAHIQNRSHCAVFPVRIPP